MGVDDATGSIDPMGLFASGSFAEIRATWQALLPPEMINLEHDISYRAEVKRLVRELAHGNTIPKGDVATPLRKLADAGFKLAVLTNDSRSSARQNLVELGIEVLFDPVIGADSGYGASLNQKAFYIAVLSMEAIRRKRLWSVIRGPTMGRRSSPGCGFHLYCR